MTAFFMQELILERFVGLVHAWAPGRPTTRSGMPNGGVFPGRLSVALGATCLRLGTLRDRVVAGCLGAAAALGAFAAVGVARAGWLPTPTVMALGFCNGIFAVAAIGAMIQRSGEGRARRTCGRMGLWGATQAVAAGLGGLQARLLAALLRLAPMSGAQAFSAAFLIGAALVVAAAATAARVMAGHAHALPPTPSLIPGE